MDQFKKGFSHMSLGVSISKDICTKIDLDKNRMQEILHAYVIKSITYVMLCIRPNVSYILSVMNRYQVNPCENH